LAKYLRSGENDAVHGRDVLGGVLNLEAELLEGVVVRVESELGLQEPGLHESGTRARVSQ
jgi:hypothetical protein